MRTSATSPHIFNTITHHDFKFFDSSHQAFPLIDIKNVILFNPAGLMDPPNSVLALRAVCCGGLCNWGMEFGATLLTWSHGDFNENSTRGSYFDPRCKAADLSVELNRGFSGINQVLIVY
jgi:hypothetical protein